MKICSLRNLVAATALGFALQSEAQVLTQALQFNLAGIQAGPTTTNSHYIATPGQLVRINTKDVIGLLVTNAPSDLRHASLLILSDFTGTNSSYATTVVIRGIKGATNDTDVTHFFTFGTDTSVTPVVTGRDTTNGVSAGHTTYSLGSVTIQDGTNAPILSVSGYKTQHVVPAVEWSNHIPVTGVSTSWSVESAAGFGPGTAGSIPVYGGVSAGAEMVDLGRGEK